MNIMFYTTFILSLIMLTTPIIMYLVSSSNKLVMPTYIKTMTSVSFMLSMTPTLLFIYSNNECTISNWHWISIQMTQINMSFKLDYFSILFMSIALFITWSIMEFSMWYMKSEPHMTKFFMYLLMFLITMLILVTANNLFQLFIGWEGVGIMSFLLIGWWYGRTEANTSALQAILYNRIGDIGFVLSMIWFMLYLNTWELQQIFMLDNNLTLIPLMGILLAATGKSAQFGLHPWLPSAMEGPTPVSALLHSSTMVVAGIFLLIRFYPLIQMNHTVQSAALCLGAVTSLFTAMCALTQNDIKKIIAFSTSSQLGLMMVTIGINQPHLAFLHICTHAFFKAMLFMCSGVIIHNLNDEQDIRKMGNLYKTLPFTSSCLTIGSLALMGTPFLTGFYSKDLIIESMNTSYTNAWALLITLIATSLTAVYSMRIIFYTLLNNPQYPSTNMNENNKNLINSIMRLAIGSIIAGFIITSNIPPMNIPPMTMPFYMKMTALLVTSMGLFTALELNLLTLNLKTKYSSNHYNFSSMLGYYTTIMHRQLPFQNLMFSQKMASTTLDMTNLEYLIPKSISKFHVHASTMTSNQTALLKTYFMSFLLSLLMVLIMII